MTNNKPGMSQRTKNELKSCKIDLETITESLWEVIEYGVDSKHVWKSIILDVIVAVNKGVDTLISCLYEFDAKDEEDAYEQVRNYR